MEKGGDFMGKEYDFEVEYMKLFVLLRDRRIEYLSELQRLIDELKNVQSQGSTRKKEVYRIRERIIDAGDGLKKTNQFLSFLRMGNREDADYRIEIYANFHELIKEKVGDSLPLRFHGTSIFYAKEIIRSGRITSSQDRFGYITSTDLNGHFSATKVNNIDETIKGYTHLLDFRMPAGCVFVLLPGIFNRRLVYENQMKNVNFRKNPRELFAIMTTPENIERVKSWCMTSGIDPSKVCDFYEFLRRFDKSEEFQNGISK